MLQTPSPTILTSPLESRHSCTAMSGVERFMSKKAPITDITGQDGSYLTEFLLDKGYEVHGVVRRASVFNTDRIEITNIGVGEFSGTPSPALGPCSPGGACAAPQARRWSVLPRCPRRCRLALP